MKKPICSTCNDTHRMTLQRDGHEDQVVMCTFCPVPCQKCRENGNGPFCGTTPCACDCHANHPSYQKPSWVTEHKETGCPLPFGHDPPCRPDLMRRSGADPVPGLREAAQLIFQMTEIYQHNPEALRALEDVRGAILKRAGRDPKEQGSAQYLDERRPNGADGWQWDEECPHDPKCPDRTCPRPRKIPRADVEALRLHEIEKCRGLVSNSVSVQAAFEALTVLAVQARTRAGRPLPSVLTIEEISAACNNIGYDITCGACAMRFFTGFTLPTSRADMLPPDHEATCKTDISYLAADPIEVTNEPR
jgi:hypothetical protein